MTTPDVPLRLELTFELPGTPEQVWDAIATANGISAWMMPTDLEEREGGAIVFHMGEDDSPGTITGWEPPRRLTALRLRRARLGRSGGHEGARGHPDVHRVPHRGASGGTCVLRVVTSAFGTGADWEQEFFDDMERHWRPIFDHLRLYLTHFPGQRVTPLAVDADVPGSADAVWSAIRRDLGVADVGRPIEARGLTAQVERLTACNAAAAPHRSGPRFLSVQAWSKNEDVTCGQGCRYLFSADATGFVEREAPAWKAWLDGLVIPSGRPPHDPHALLAECNPPFSPPPLPGSGGQLSDDLSFTACP